MGRAHACTNIGSGAYSRICVARACNCAAKMPPLDMQIVRNSRVYELPYATRTPAEFFSIVNASPTTPETRQYFINPFDRKITEVTLTSCLDTASVSNLLGISEDRYATSTQTQTQTQTFLTQDCVCSNLRKSHNWSLSFSHLHASRDAKTKVPRFSAG